MDIFYIVFKKIKSYERKVRFLHDAIVKYVVDHKPFNEKGQRLFEGNLEDVFRNNYIEFTVDGIKNGEAPRYGVISSNSKGCPIATCTEVQLDRNLDVALDSDDLAHVYTTQYPEGYFSQIVDIQEGINLIFVFSFDVHGKQSDILVGMVANVDIITGKKSIMDYILKPIIKARQNALTER